MIGHATEDFQEEKLPEIKQKCEKIFTDFIVQRAEENGIKKLPLEFVNIVLGKMCLIQK